jgi:nucleotide-binding universal stress UspA family protein
MNVPPRSILACADFSAASDAALERAAALATDFGARLTLLHVVSASLWGESGRNLAHLAGFQPPQPDEVEREVRQRLEQRAHGLAQRRKGAVDGATQAAASAAQETPHTEVEVAHGRVATEITRLAAERGVDLIIVGAHGAHAVLSAMLGTTAQRLVQTAPCPVLVVKRMQPIAYKTVLLPTDFSPPAINAARVAGALWPHAVFHAVHAYELPYEGLMTYAGASAESVTHYHRQAETRLHAELMQFIRAAGLAPGHAVAHVRHGYPSTLIEEWVQRLRADLVVIAAQGKSQMEALFLGSVSAHVVQTARCDVLLVRNGAAQ